MRCTYRCLSLAYIIAVALLTTSFACQLTGSERYVPISEPFGSGDWYPLKNLSVTSVGDLLCLEYSPGGEFLAVGGELGIAVLDSTTHDQVVFLDDLTRVVSLSFSPNDSYLVGGSHLVLPTPGEETMKTWNTHDWSVVTTLFPTLDQLSVLSFSPDGSLVAALEMGVVHVWNALSWNHVAEFPNGHGSGSIVFSPNGTYIAGGWEDGINLFETTNWTLVNHVESPLPVSPIGFSPNGTRLASVELHGPTKILETSTWSSIRTLTPSWVRILTFSPDNAFLATWKDNGTIVMWNTTTWTSFQELSGSSWLSDLVFSPNSTQLVAGSANGDISLWSYFESIPPAPPTEVDAFFTGHQFENLTIRWTISADDDAGTDIVSGYHIYRATSFGRNGAGYLLIGSASSGTGEFLDEHVGEGDPNSYFYRVCAVDALTRSSCSEQQVGKFTRPLSPGPNLVSVPLVQSDENIETVLQTLRYDQAWFYDTSSQEWIWSMKSKTYRRGLWNMNHTGGVWVNVTESSRLTVAGAVPTQTVIHLQSGWNLVSFPSFNTSYTVADLKAETGATRVEGMETIPPYPPCRLKVLGDADVLTTGEAYWVRVDADMDWMVEVS
jgi:WD40 repeat protein